MEIETRPAGPSDLERLLPLFDAYRIFYEQPSDLEGARAFLRERLAREEATVYLAFADGAAEPAGFALLYRAYSDVAMTPVVVLNDLYTGPSFRRRGVGEALILASAAFARAQGAAAVRLVTAADNAAAKRLYERMGFLRDTVFEAYSLPL